MKRFAAVDKAFGILNKKYVDDNSFLKLRNTEYWDLLQTIKEDRQAAIELGYANLKSLKTIERFFGITLLSEICNPVETEEESEALEIGKEISSLVDSEKTVICLEAIANALGRMVSDDGLEALIKLSYSENDEIRWSATSSLGMYSSEPKANKVLERLKELSKDRDPEIREYATMWLGSFLNLEGDQSALESVLAHLKDRHISTRIEAMFALIENDDPRGITPLKGLLRRDKLSDVNKVIEAAGILGSPELLSDLQEWLSVGNKKQILGNYYLSEWAEKRCFPDPRIKNSVDDQWMGDDWYLKVINGERKPIKYRDL